MTEATAPDTTTVEPDPRPVAATLKPSWSIPAAELNGAFNRVKHAAAVDEARPILAAILVEQRGDAIRLVAADNYRIALLTLRVDIVGKWKPAILSVHDLPVVQAFLKSRQKGATVKVIRINADHLRFASSYGAVEARLIHGTFPNVAIVTDPEPSRVVISEVAVNPKYLGDVKHGLGPNDAGIVRIAVASALEPLDLSIGDDYREIIMPVRITS